MANLMVCDMIDRGTPRDAEANLLVCDMVDEGTPHDQVVNLLDSDMVVNELEFHSRITFFFGLIPFEIVPLQPFNKDDFSIK